MLRKIFLFFFIVLTINSFADNVKVLSFTDFISLVLEKDLNIKIYKINRDIAKNSIKKYQGFFDPIFSSSLKKSFTKEYIGSRLQSISNEFVLNKNVNFDMSISKKFVTGTNISLRLKNNRFKTNSDWSVLNPEYSSTLLLNIDQPILKGFGIRINKSSIIKAEHFLKKEEFDVKNYINNEILDAAKVYFELVYSYEYLQAKKESLNLAKDIYSINFEKVKLGLVPENILLESKAEIASREEDVIKAKQQIEDTEDRLKKYFNDITSSYNIVPITKFFNKPTKLSLKSAINKALKNRYELKKIEQDIKIAKVDLMVKKNSKLPELNLNLYAGLTGKGSGISDDYKRLRSNEYHNWGVGVTFSYPLSNKIARSEYNIAKLQVKKIELEKKELEQEIILQVKSSYRNLKTLQKRIIANEKSVESAFEKMKIEQEKYKNNLSTVFRVFSYQTDYINEKIKLTRAKIDYTIELLNFYRTIGNDLFKIN